MLTSLKQLVVMIFKTNRLKKDDTNDVVTRMKKTAVKTVVSYLTSASAMMKIQYFVGLFNKSLNIFGNKNTTVSVVQ